jgi:tRNA(Ile)-lysidine synthase
MDAAALRGRTLEVRAWRPGDWMRPCGFPHRRKLQDIFMTAKTPPSVRHALPLVVDAMTGEVLWIPGYRVSETVKVSAPDAPSVRFRAFTGVEGEPSGGR